MLACISKSMLSDLCCLIGGGTHHFFWELPRLENSYYNRRFVLLLGQLRACLLYAVEFLRLLTLYFNKWLKIKN